MTLDQARRDYRNDPTFHRVVDTMVVWIRDAQVSPAEVRSAAMLACMMVEETRPSSYYHSIFDGIKSGN